MVYHTILGLLWDGRPRHGYELVRQYRLRSGRSVNPGNVYRECSKLVTQGFVTPDAKAPDADPRRIPYRITPAGRVDFDAWLLEPKPLHPELDHWAMFADLLPRVEFTRLLDEIRESLWMEGKSLAIARDRAAARHRKVGGDHYQPSMLLSLRRIKQVTAELEFLQELRKEIEQLAPLGLGEETRAQSASPATPPPSRGQTRKA